MKKVSPNHEISYGISFKEHQEKAQRVFEEVVRPQIKAEEKLKQLGLLDEKPTLSHL